MINRGLTLIIGKILEMHIIKVLSFLDIQQKKTMTC
ncbi:hypothetical protein HK44_002065 [Pseudomonas fluorescens HK44]|uniref:Uncharacterized protein n=1 Tax=Pseudomonas fluorescens HK44 TaxID=1042209 RepID=A0A010RPA4_PSEFL|nr:hypothetical protein HK44_002065 [Pseudomonas fluorescens HK44]